MSELLIALVSGGVGAVIGPWITHWIGTRQKEQWAKPRRELLSRVLNDPNKRFKSIDYLSRIVGCSTEDTRTLLIEIGARGATLKSKKEGWALIRRAPLREDLRKIEAEEQE